MRLSVIVTTFDVAPWVGACLESLGPCLRPGDEVIVVDDGSSDGTAELVEAALADAARWPEGVVRRPILIGTNTPGGVGIPANIGLMHADREAVFFVDGDDWLEAEGFRAARAAFEASGAELLIATYLEHDEARGEARPPSDAWRWAGLPAVEDAEARRRFALSLIAVPWRKFYRADFLARHGLRFPEGPFFYEDNPFHWDVCLAAGRIAFADVPVCRHRINRPGQTMAATGLELLAFFDHYDRIRARIPPDRDDLAGAAVDWLLGNMAWHVGRLAPHAFWPWAARAAEALAHPAPAVWAGALARHRTTQIGGIAAALRGGDIGGVVAAWTAERCQRETEGAIGRLAGEVAALGRALGRIAAGVEALRLIAEFDALAALDARAAAPERRSTERP